MQGAVQVLENGLWARGAGEPTSKGGCKERKPDRKARKKAKVKPAKRPMPSPASSEGAKEVKAGGPQCTGQARPHQLLSTPDLTRSRKDLNEQAAGIRA